MIIAKVTIARRALERLLDQPMYLGLFINDDVGRGRAPVEPSGGGYRGRTLRLADWAITIENDRAIATATHAFTFDGSRRFDIYGAYVAEVGSGELHFVDIFEERFPARRMGDTLSASPLIGLRAVAVGG